MKRRLLHKLGLLFPALTWLFIQFSMTGMMIGTSADAMQITICSADGLQQISVNPETGEPVEPAVGGEGCEWCQSFGSVTDCADRGEVSWIAIARSFQQKLVLAPPPHKPLRFVADYDSRAPPFV
ncbi:hypothetical protein PXK00_07875 [Phaeobacter sp. QD34_3]|uniref:DUF2946 family protein n=1 Tax=unclassified Phaeobacter TaxID=2621772 RepID=UPI00237FC1EA|nr:MULTISPECIES: DUF2946 family protein [unclassified Phaeobacter]MDE4133025.1 hypothetical protein [Phaeobacter sp. QD34_3]MDE4136573.1 hypothetical protein [Phaeobacter sp. QD34_24]